METAITLVSPPEMTLAEEEKGQLSALVQIKLEETKTLTLVSTDGQFLASAFYSGPNQAIYFKGTQGTAGNVWAGTPLKDFQVGPGARVEGYVSRDGRFSVSTTSNYRLLAADAALTITVTDHDITARGTLTTPIASAQVSGAIGFDGSFAWSGVAHVNVGGGDNYLSDVWAGSSLGQLVRPTTGRILLHGDDITELLRQLFNNDPGHSSSLQAQRRTAPKVTPRSR